MSEMQMDQTKIDFLGKTMCRVLLMCCFPFWICQLVSSDLFAQEEGSETSQVEQINKYIRQTWSDYELKPSAQATDSEWCRRVYLDIVGRIPTVQELKSFTADKSGDKKKRLVETLLYDDSYTEEFVRNWTTLWTNILIGRTGGIDNDSMISRSGMQKYLRDTFARNKPYDKMVYELITATGKTTPGESDFNGAVNFLIDKVNEENAALATASTSRIFLGLQVQCTQCHNHPFNDWKQQKYWEMNAFFRQVRAFPGGMRGSDAAAELADQDFSGESGNIEEADLFFELRNGLIKVAYPVFVDGSSVDRSGYVNVVNRRKVLADKVVESPYFSKVAVNRVWAHFLGYGFTNPVDDLGPHNIPTHPELVEYLAQEFRSNQFDIRKLVSWITLSEPYSLSSRRTKNNESDDPLLGEPPKFTHFYLRQMRAEELYESLVVATQAGAASGNYEQQEAQKSNWLRQFSQAFGTDEGDETTTFNGTIPQVLMMFNGDLIKQATSPKGGLIDRLVNDPKMDDKDRVEYLFLAGLGRKPSRDEAALAKQFYHARSGDVREALTDLWWVVLNSNEFIFNH